MNLGHPNCRMIGRYRFDVALAQSRVVVAWDRIILPDNQTVEISAFGGDELGRTGTTSFVDTRFAQRFAWFCRKRWVDGLSVRVIC